MTNEFDIIDHPLVLMWFKDFAKNEARGLAFLTQGNSQYFKSIWGGHNGKTQKFLYWKREYLGITIYIYSDDTATFYKVQYLGEKEVFLSDKKMGSYLIGFLNKLTKEIIS
ncbi:hypothetical protein GW796_10520 [archaeon]|nr:hypothetical protein [archaeon]